MKSCEDYGSLIMGGGISVVECQQLIGFSENEKPKEYGLAMLQIMAGVTKAMREKYQRRVTVRIVKGGIQILTDSEAAVYNATRFDQGLKIARRSHRRSLAVDVAGLSQAEKDAHQKNLAIQGAKLSMLRTKIDVELPATTRSTPRMFEGRR
jgi:hypothetical protein